MKSKTKEKNYKRNQLVSQIKRKTEDALII